MSRTSLSSSVIARIQMLARQGKSTSEIVRATGVSETSVRKYKKVAAPVKAKPAKKAAKKSSVAKTIVAAAAVNKPVSINEVFFVIDESGSMNNLTSTVERVFRRTVDEMVQSAASAGILQRFGLVRFGGPRYQTLINTIGGDVDGSAGPTSHIFTISNLSADEVKLAMQDYDPYGSTPLLSSTVAAVEASDAKANSRLIVVLTDGQENTSTASAHAIIRNLATNTPANLTLAFMVPTLSGKHLLERYGISSGNISVWSVSERGLDKAATEISQSYGNFTRSVAAGATNTAGYFTANLSSVSKSAAQRALTPISNYKLVRSGARERTIKDVVEEQTNAAYVRGNAYYELVKTEKVIHAGKQILIRDPVSGEVFGGADAREKLGLPAGRIKMKPGEHGRWQLFIQSTSINRLIPANTNVVVLS